MCVVDVTGVTQLHDVVYIVCWDCPVIQKFSARTHERLADINVMHLRRPRDIAACQQTSEVYVADFMDCVWRVSSDGEDIRHWWPLSRSLTLKPYTLSVTSTRVLVASLHTNQLIQLDAVSNEARSVPLPDCIHLAYHAMESPTGTFVVVHNCTPREDHWKVSELNDKGQMLRQFSSTLGAFHLAIDTQGNIFVIDRGNGILLLNDHLALRRVILDKHQLNNKLPLRLCYNEQSGQLLFGFGDSNYRHHERGGFAVFDVLQQ